MVCLLGDYSFEGISAFLVLLAGLLLCRKLWKHRRQRRDYILRERVRREFWG
jgi:hypothetical protein